MPRSGSQTSRTAHDPAATPTCRSCIHFDDDPGRLETEVPGILVFGSAYGSSRGHAGLCSKLDRFLDPLPASSCPSFEAIPGSLAERTTHHSGQVKT